MLVKRGNPGNLPGILTEARAGVDGVPIRSPHADEVEIKEIDPTIYSSQAEKPTKKLA